MITGRLIGIGVGPGDPELLTVKAVKAIRAAPVVAYISANGRPSMARQIAAEYMTGPAKEIKFTLPMHPSPEIARSAYDEGASRIGAELEQGRDVAVLCEGDPMFYGSFGHIIDRLGHQYPTEIVPGISSVMAAAAAARQPLAFGTESFVALPATMPEDLLAARLRSTSAAVIMKLGRHLQKIRTVLDHLEIVDRAIYVEHASSFKQKVIALADLDLDEAPYFSLIIVKRQHR